MNATIQSHPDAALLAAWRDAEAADQSMDATPEDEGANAAHVANWSRAYTVVCTTPAFTIEGLVVKVRALALDAMDGETDHAADLARTAIEAAERLAAGHGG